MRALRTTRTGVMRQISRVIWEKPGLFCGGNAMVRIGRLASRSVAMRLRCCTPQSRYRRSSDGTRHRGAEARPTRRDATGHRRERGTADRTDRRSARSAWRGAAGRDGAARRRGRRRAQGTDGSGGGRTLRREYRATAFDREASLNLYPGGREDSGRALRAARRRRQFARRDRAPRRRDACHVDLGGLITFIDRPALRPVG